MKAKVAPYTDIKFQLRQVSFKEEVGIRVNQMVIMLMLCWSVENLPIFLAKWCI